MYLYIKPRENYLTFMLRSSYCPDICTLIREYKIFMYYFLLRSESYDWTPFILAKYIFVECTGMCIMSRRCGVLSLLYHNCSMNKFIELLCFVIYFDWICRKKIYRWHYHLQHLSFCIIWWGTWAWKWKWGEKFQYLIELAIYNGNFARRLSF